MSENLFTREPLAKSTRKTTERESNYPFEKMAEPDFDDAGNVVAADTWYSSVGDDVVGKIQSKVGAFNRKHSEPTGTYRTMQRKQKDGTIADISVEIRKPVKKLSVKVLVVPADAEEFAGEKYAQVQRVL